MKEQKRRQSLSGAVLIMVLTVMVVLIIMLMATLTVVTTANQRIFTRYEENQAYYAARSALDVFTGSIVKDSKFIATENGAERSYEYVDTDGITIGSAKIKQGLAMELEMYKITANNDAGIVSNAYTNDKIFGDSTNAEKVNNINYSADDAIVPSIEYTVTFPDVRGNSGDDYGRMVDGSSADGAVIKMEVEQRYYNFGGGNSAAFDAIRNFDPSLHDINNESAFKNSDGVVTADSIFKKISDSGASGAAVKITNKADHTELANGTYKKQDLIDAIKAGDRSKDFMRLKITSTARFMDNVGTAVLYCDTTEKPRVNTNQGLTSMGSAVGVDSLMVFGGASALHDVNATNSSTVTGDLFISGNFLQQLGSSKYSFYADTVYTVLGNLSFNNGGVSAFDFKKPGSVLYIGDRVDFDGDGTQNSLATAANPTNVIAGTIRIHSDSSTTFNANMYCDVLIPTQDKTPVINGTIYADQVDLTQLSNTGQPNSVVVDWASSPASVDLTGFTGAWPQVKIAQGFILNNETGVPTYYMLNADGNTLTDSTNPSSTITISSAAITNTNRCSEVKISYRNPAEYTIGSDYKKEFELPGNLAGQSTKKVKIPTMQTLYSEIMKPEAFVKDAVDTGFNGDIDTSKAEYPEFTDTSLLGTYLGTTMVPDNNWPYDMVPAASLVTGREGNIPLIAVGIITAENRKDYGYGEYYDPNWDTDVKVATAVFEAAKAADPTYQQALSDYYAVYLTGAEKAKETRSPSLNVETTILDASHGTLISATGYHAANSAEDARMTQAINDTHARYVINQSGVLKPDNNSEYGNSGTTPSNPVIIDATNNDIILQLGDNTMSSNVFSGAFIVLTDSQHSHSVKVYLPDGKETYDLGHNGASGQQFYITTYEIYQAMKSTLKLSDTNGTPSPDVFVYAGDNVKNVKLQGETFLGAHVYMPFANFTQLQTSIYKPHAMTYRGNNAMPADNFGLFVVGSLVCKTYKNDNKTGVAYIAQDANDYTPGDPVFAWNPYRYARN